MDANISPARIGGMKALSALVASMLLTSCAVTPQLATQEEVKDRVKSDTARMYLDQAPITAPVTLEEAVARALKYNLEHLALETALG